MNKALTGSVCSVLAIGLILSLAVNWHFNKTPMVAEKLQPKVEYTLNQTRVTQVKQVKQVKKENSEKRVIPEVKHSSNFSKQESQLTPEEQVTQVNAHAAQLVKSGRAVEAEKLLLSNIEKDPKNFKIREQLAKLYLNQQRLLEAESVLTDAEVKGDDNYKNIVLLSRIYHQSQKYDQAIKSLLQLSPTDQQTAEVLALFASAYYERGIYAEAAKNYTKLVQADQNQPRWWLGLALSNEASGQKKEALSSYRQVATLGKLEPKVINFVKHKINELVEYA